MRNKTVYIFYCISAFIFLSSMIKAQNKYNSEYLPPDPQTWGFIKYGGGSPDFYTGTIKTEIPIYVYKDPDFEIPISLTYTSAGYMPNITANYVGLGWTLNVGGLISRRVRGVKDEGELENVSYGGGLRTVSGYYRYTQTNHSSDGSLLERPTRVTGIGICFDKNNQLYDTQSDIYVFNFLGHSGKFVITDNGGVQIYDTNHPSGEYRVSLYSFQKIRLKSKIIITTGDGYIFEFGGHPEVDNLTNNYIDFEKWGVSEGGSSAPARDSYSDEWYLTKVIAPNGRTAVFNYKIDSETLTESIYPTGERVIYYGRLDSPGFPSGFEEGSGMYSVGYRLLQRKHSVLLSSIVIDDCTISFTYGPRNAEKGWKVVAHVSDLLTPPKLESIKVTHPNAANDLCNCTLSYKYPSISGNPVLLLSKVSIAGSGEYALNYQNETSVFPYQGIVGMDHWGFYNNNTGFDPHNLLPSVDVGTDYTETITSANRNPDWTKAAFGLLKKIAYPTGGWTEFEYEPNNYSRKIERRSAPNPGQPYPYPVQGNPQGGGLRVSRIVDHVSLSEWTDRRYYYSSGSVSSGIMLKFPRYSYTYSSSGPNQQVDYTRYSYSGNPGYLLDEPIVEYSTVREVFRDGSAKEYRFSCYNQIPDVTILSGGYIYNPVNSPNISVVFPSNAYLLFATPTSKATARGKLISVKTKDSDGNLLSCIRNIYSTENISNRYTESLLISVDSVYIHRHYTGPCILSSAREVEYTSSGDSLVIATEYSYNSRNQQKHRKVTNSEGKDIYYFTSYIGDGIGTMTYMESNMAVRNILNKPIYQGSYVRSSNRYVPLEISHFVYDFMSVGGSSFPLLSSVEVANLSNVSPMTSLSAFSTLPYKTVYEITTYNSFHRPCEFVDANGINTVLLWGYGGLYPVAEVINGTGVQLGKVVHAEGNISNTVFGWTGVDTGTEQAFRGIPGTSVTTWKYSPFVGVSEKTGPDKRKTTYQYNSFGRLSSIIGPDSHTLIHYDYSINGEIQ